VQVTCFTTLIVQLLDAGWLGLPCCGQCPLGFGNLLALAFCCERICSPVLVGFEAVQSQLLWCLGLVRFNQHRACHDAVHPVLVLQDQTGMGGVFCMHHGFDRGALDANGGDVVLHAVFSPNTTMKNPRSYLAGLNRCMNFKDIQHRNQTDHWLATNGVNVAHIYAGTAELFQATKLATATLKDWSRLLEQNQAHTLNNFLKQASNKNLRLKITQGQCFKVMNIAKQAQRKMAKLNKER